MTTFSLPERVRASAEMLRYHYSKINPSASRNWHRHGPRVPNYTRNNVYCQEQVRRNARKRASQAFVGFCYRQ